MNEWQAGALMRALLLLLLTSSALAAELPKPGDPRCVPIEYWEAHKDRVTEHVYRSTAELYAAARANPEVRVRYGFSRRERLMGFADAGSWSVHYVDGAWDHEHGISVRHHEFLHLACPGWGH